MSTPAPSRRSGRLRRWSVRIGAVLVLGLVAFLIITRPEHHPTPKPRSKEDAMQAIIYREYGDPGVLHLEPVAKPVPVEGKVLIEVHAAAANPLDWHYLHGTPYVMRLGSGWTRPADERVGVDVAGRVVAVGPGVTRFKAGDEVFGTSPGSFAEYSVGSERRLALKPPALTYEQAAAVPVAAITALQGLRDKGAVKPGQRVLINGASGGVGTFAVQIAKVLGAHVTGVCSTRNLALVRSLGSDAVVDYTREDFTRGDNKYDIVLDLVGNRGLSDVRRILTPTGIYVLIGGGGPNDGRIIGPFAKVIGAAAYSAMYDQSYSMMLADITPHDLELIGGWIASGRVRSVIDRRYPLSEAPDALRYLETGRARGKVIVVVRPDEAVRALATAAATTSPAPASPTPGT